MMYCSGAAYLQIIGKVSSKSLANSYLGNSSLAIQFLIIKVVLLPWIQKELLGNIVDADSQICRCSKINNFESARLFQWRKKRKRLVKMILA
jgi:hypothetical protein